MTALANYAQVGMEPKAQAPPKNGGVLTIGGLKGNGIAPGFKGTIDAVRIMSRALASDELLHYPLAQWSMTAEPPQPFDLSNVVGRIAFNIDGKELWTARPDGSDAKKILTTKVTSVDFSMDGRALIYANGSNLRRVSVDGTGDVHTRESAVGKP